MYLYMYVCVYVNLSPEQVISFAGELLKLAESLLRDGLHTSEIVTGYQRAYEKTLELMPQLVVRTITDVRDPVQLLAGIKSVIATKQYGYEEVQLHSHIFIRTYIYSYVHSYTHTCMHTNIQQHPSDMFAYSMYACYVCMYVCIYIYISALVMRWL